MSRRRIVPVRRGHTVLALALLCAGCADSPVLDLFGGGAGLSPPGAETGPVRRATGERTEWPNLASVPPRPKEFSTPAEREDLRRRLEQDRAGARDGAGEAAGSAAPTPALPDMTGPTPPPADRLEIPAAPPAPPAPAS